MAGRRGERGGLGKEGNSRLEGMIVGDADLLFIEGDAGESYVEKRETECRANEQITY